MVLATHPAESGVVTEYVAHIRYVRTDLVAYLGHPFKNVTRYGRRHRIGALLEDEASWTRMAKSALEWSSHFDWDVAADEMAVALVRARKQALPMKGRSA